jgi:hypothetical protein
LNFDLDGVLRRLKPSKRTAALVRRPPAELPFVDEHLVPGPELLLDTTVYLDELRDRSPVEVDQLMRLRICNRSTVCLAALTHDFGRLDPANPGTLAALDRCRDTIAIIRPHRLSEPSLSVWGAAGILAGLAFRLGNCAKGQERKWLNDALVFLQAVAAGQAVLTGNIRDFDFLNQLVPDGRVIFYRSWRETLGRSL